MTFEFKDAWLLHSIYASEKPELGADLRDIIAYADYVNHDILTYAELAASLPKLLIIGLVVQLNKNLVTTDIYKAWWASKFENKKTIYVLKALDDAKTFLNSSFETAELLEITVAINIQQQDWDRAYADYSKGFSKYL